MQQSDPLSEEMQNGSQTISLSRTTKEIEPIYIDPYKQYPTDATPPDNFPAVILSKEIRQQ